MTAASDPILPPVERSWPGLEPGDLDGHTIDELGDYLDRGRTPPDESIDNSPGCQNALAAMTRLRTISRSLLDSDAREQKDVDGGWIASILDNIGLEARAGRDIPIHHTSSTATLAITEGAVRSLVRAAGDSVGGLLIGRCILHGDVAAPGEPITVQIDVSVFWGERIPEVVARAREAIYTELLKHTELRIAGIDVTVHDVQLTRSEPREEERP